MSSFGFKKYFLFIFFIFLGWLLASDKMDLAGDQELSDEGKMLYKYVAQVGKEIGKKYEMSQCSIGGGVDHGISLMSLDFERYSSPLTEQEARRLIVSCVEDYLTIINQQEELRPFLKNYPFKPENIDMGIFISALDGKTIVHPYICTVKAFEGKVAYFTEEESNPFTFKSEKYETYEEALQILQQERKADSSN